MYQAGREDETSQRRKGGAGEDRPRSRSSSWRPARCCSARRARRPGRGRHRDGPRADRAAGARLRGSSAACSSARTTARRRSTTRCPRWCSTAILESLDGARSYFLASDIAEFERYRYQLDDAVTSGKLDAGVRHLQPLPAAQPRAHEVRARRRSKKEPDFTLDETFEFDREQGALGQQHAPSSTSSGASASRTTRCR